jgi:hypothetical protein
MSESTKDSEHPFAFKEVQMRKTLFAGLIAAMTLAAASAAQAAPAAPLPAGATAEHSNLTQVQWWGWRGHYRYYHPGWRWRYRYYGYHRHWRCWWAYGHRHCRWW